MSNFHIYRFQTKIKNSSINYDLAEFLKNKDSDLTEKERVWWAVSAFWLPLALMESKNQYSKEEISRYGLSAIKRLQEQINYLVLILNLPTSCDTYTSDENTISNLDGLIEGDTKKESNQDTLKVTVSNNDLDNIFGYK